MRVILCLAGKYECRGLGKELSSAQALSREEDPDEHLIKTTAGVYFEDVYKRYTQQLRNKSSMWSSLSGSIEDHMTGV